jgi:hypothetical protein
MRGKGMLLPLILVDTSLSSLMSYVMSMVLLNKTFIEKVDKHRRRFFWHGKGEKGVQYGEMD